MRFFLSHGVSLRQTDYRQLRFRRDGRGRGASAATLDVPDVTLTTARGANGARVPIYRRLNLLNIPATCRMALTLIRPTVQLM